MRVRKRVFSLMLTLSLVQRSQLQEYTVMKGNISAQKSAETRERLKKKERERETGFPSKAGVICPPDVTSQGTASWVSVLFDLELQTQPLSLSSNT